MRKRRGAFTIAVGLVASAAIVAVALVFAASVEGSAVSAEAVAFTETESALAAATTSQGAVQLALTVSEANPADGERVVAEARNAVTVTRDRLARVDQASNAGEALEVRYVDSAFDTLDFIDGGDFDSAKAMIDGTFVAQYSELVVLLAALRDEQGSHIAAMGDQAAAVAQVTRFAIGLAIPFGVGLTVLIAYRRREAQRILQEQIESERTLRTSREDFIANVSHELRTPLTAVYGFAQLLDSGAIDDPGEYADLVRLIYGESGELVRMVDDLLTAARLTEGALAYKYESVSAQHEIAEVAEVFRLMGTEVSVQVADGFLKADRLRFRQIIRNLLSNAARYGGDRVMVHGEIVEPGFQLVIADNGSGVPGETQDTMFERFSQYEDASLARGGVGLGLSIVRTLLEDMGGSISYERIDGWSRFLIDLPHVQQTPEPPPPEEKVDAIGDAQSVGDLAAAVSGGPPVVATALSTAVARIGPAGPRPERTGIVRSPTPGKRPEVAR